MSNRYNGFAVTLEESIKDEDAQKVIEAILMIKGVIVVEPVVEDISSIFAKNQAQHELRLKLYEIFNNN